MDGEGELRQNPYVCIHDPTTPQTGSAEVLAYSAHLNELVNICLSLNNASVSYERTKCTV
jgi:hypothetical protein